MAYMQPPQQGIPRLLAMKDPTNPILMHMSPMEAAQITAMRGQGFNPQTGLPVLGRAEGGMLQPEKPPYADIAQELEEKGRFGDTHLLHVRDDELQGLSSLGQLTVNPDTGLPEAFSFKSLVPALVGTAVTIASGGSMAPLMAAGMGGLATFGTSMAMGNSLEQSLLSGFMTFGGGAIAGGGPAFGAEAGAGAGVGASTGSVMGSGGELAMSSMGNLPLNTVVNTPMAATAASAVTPAMTTGMSGAFPSTPAEAFALDTIRSSPSFVGPSGGLELGVAPSSQSLVSSQGFIGPPLDASGQAIDANIQSAIANNMENYSPGLSTLNEQGQLLTSNPLPEARQQIVGTRNLTGDGITKFRPGEYYDQGSFNEFFKGKIPAEGLTRSEQIAYGYTPRDATMAEKFQAFGNNPAKMAKGIGIPVAGAMLTADPYIPPESEDLESTFSTYTPRERTLVGSRPRSETFEEIQERMLRGAGDTQFQPFSPHRFVNEGGLVGLNRGGRPREGGPPTGLPPDTGLQANSFARGLMMAMNRITGEKQKEEQQKGTTGLTGLNEGGMLNANYPRYNSGSTIGFNDGGQPKMPTLPISLQAIMKRLNVEDYSPFLEFADKTEEVESRGGEDRINKNSSARGNFQWLTKVDPNAKKGKHGSVKTAVNRTISSYKDMGQDIPEWLNTLNKNSTKSTKDLEKNILSLTPEQERELFFGNMNKQTGSDRYLSKIATGDQQAMIDAYSIFHHTEGKTDKPTAKRANEIFLAESTTTTAPNMGLASLPQEEIIVEGMQDTRPDKKYTVQSGDTLSQLAADSGMSVEDIMKANLSRISDPDKIYAGQQIALSDSPDIPNPVRMDSEGNKTSTDSLLETVKEIIPNFIQRSAGGGIGQYYAQGGSTGQYYEGQVIGQGDGMSDEILFEVEGNNPDKALLSRDEYVIPADVVAMLGNGSSNAGAEQLDSFMRNIRQQSFGTPEQQRQMNPQQGLSQLV